MLISEPKTRAQSYSRVVHGFTMIELVMVIVIVGILTAAALPRFANFTSQSKLATHRAFAGQFKSAVGIAHAQWVALGSVSLSGGQVYNITLEGQTVNMAAFVAGGYGGWPYGNGSNYTTPDSGACLNTVTQLLHHPPQVVTNAANCTESICYVAVATAAATVICTYTLNGTSNNIVYVTGTGAVTVN